MKTSHTFPRFFGRQFSPALGLAIVTACFGFAASVQAQTPAGAFVEPLQFITVDTRVDSSLPPVSTSGTTYVLGRSGTDAVLKKYGSSGAQLAFSDGNTQVTIPGITPTALAVIPGTKDLYLVGGNQIFHVDANSGTILDSNNSGTAAVTLTGVYYANNQLYLCGNYNSSSGGAVFGLSVTNRGSQAALVILYQLGSSNTLGQASKAITYGDTGAGSVNSANSIVVDDNGGIYVGGKLGTGAFASDLFNSGSFNVTYDHRTSGINSLEDAQSVLNGTATSTSPSTRSDTCGIGTLTDNGDHNYIWRETGLINVPTAAQVTFTSTTDDGSWLYVDGTYANGKQVIWDDTAHSQLAHSGTVTLLAGLHSIDWLYWNGGGPGNGSLTVSGGGLSGCVTAADFSDHQNKGYVFKFASDLSFLQNVYFTTITAGSTGGDIKELTYSKGWLYGIGYWQGAATNAYISPADNSSAGAKNIDVLKLDTGLQLQARATIKGVADNSGYSITADEAGNAYITGSYGPLSVNFFGNGDPTNQPYASLSASSPSLFIAQLDSNFSFKWVTTPTVTPANLAQPVFDFSITQPRVRWNTVLQRIFWMGYFGIDSTHSGSLVLGNPNATRTLNGPEGFIAVLDPSGLFTERVNLTVVSQFGISGSQVLPFGGPSLSPSNAVNNLNTGPVIKGVPVTVSVPSYLYRDKSGVDITFVTQGDQNKIDTLAETRISSTGYSVDENVANGSASSYSFTITKDTVVTFNWLVEHALRINSDFSQTAGSDNPNTPGHIVGLNSGAAGNPVPTVEKHWIAENEPVISAIDAHVDDTAYLSAGLPVRYIVTGYDAYGPANTASADASVTNFITFPGDDSRRQVPQFIMTGPAGINYHWKLKIGVQVGTTGLKSIGFPYVQVLSDPGQQQWNPPTNNVDGNGSGTFYFDEFTSLKIGSVLNQDTTQLKGWFDGDGSIFSSIGYLTNLTSSFTVSNVVYAAQTVNNLQRPTRVMWDYGDRIFDETVFIGNTVTFATVDDPAVRAKLRTDLAPASIQLIDSPVGSSSGNMAEWDPVGKKYYPVRPGQVLSYWYTTADPADRVIIRLTFKYPTVSHYRDIANCRPVALTPGTNNPITFQRIEYTEAATGATVDQNGNFSATGPGKTVLLFNETSKAGRGGVVVTERVRVVETHNWNDSLPNTQTAIIGQKITSVFDTAGLGTGWIFFPNARYNASVYNTNTVSGPIIPVNLNPTAGANNQLVVVWYESRDMILWPYQAVNYQPAWPTNAAQGLGRIVIGSRFGSESVAVDGTDQIVVDTETVGTNTYPAETILDPARFSQVKIYNQPDPTLPGYNPNEEHALLAPSLRSAAVSPQPMAVYALRDGDLNVTAQDSTYTSDPYVLVQFLDAVDGQYKMKVYNILRSDSNLSLGDLSYDYTFKDQMVAGEPVIPFYPLPQVIGATPGRGNYGKDGQPTVQRCYWKDHKGTAWAVSGNSFFYAYYFYPLLPDFWWPPVDNKQPGDFVAFLPDVAGYKTNVFDINKDNGSPFDYTRNDQTPKAQGIYYTTTWPDATPILKVGETLTYPGGEYSADNPTAYTVNSQGDLVTQATPGLPGVVGFAAGQIVYDTMNPTMDDQVNFNSYTARIFPALDQRTVPLAVSDLPGVLNPANGRTTVQNGVYIFNQLPSSLQKRVFYDPIRGVLGLKGLLNNKTISDSTLTASPPAVYALEPNVLTAVEQQILDGTGATSPLKDVAGTKFASQMDALYNLSRNPNQLDQGNDGVDTAYRVGLEQKIVVNPSTGQPLTTMDNYGIVSVQRDATKAAPLQALGPGLAMVANPAFLDPYNTNQISFVTVAENNSDALGSAPVALHIIKVDKTQRYRGSIMTILAPNVFDENITLRHTADFGGNADDLVFEWWYRPEDGTSALPPDTQPAPSPWKLFADPSGNQGLGFSQLTLKGNPSAPEVLLGDTLFYLRYRHKNEVHNGENWVVPQPNLESHTVLGIRTNGIPYEWAGAGNSSPQHITGINDAIIGQPEPDYIAQLAEGWVKRVLNRVNPYEARINDFTGNNPAVYSSIIQQLGAPYSGPVALNSDPNVIQNVGLIALYETILQRAESLSVGLSTPICPPSVADALELASTRISDFYTLLGNEAYSDSLNPAIGFGSSSVTYGNMAPTILAFQNQVSTRLDEELDLLHGQNANNGFPVNNRLYWNFTHAEGEAAYAMKYNITDVNNDGFIDVNDAMILYPQGHGDAWGHYLTAARMQYDLLTNPFFNWVSRSEYINSQNVVIPVDYLDERKFAQNAAAKAQAGAAIVNSTYRQKFVADPRSQWQGYLDTDPNQAWGVDEWARRAGQGAYFDWITANAILPAVHPNTNYTGIQKVDRTTVTDIANIVGSFNAIQQTMDEVDGGNNPLGLANGALPLSIDPTLGQKFFDQTYAKALVALNNAKATFDNANQFNNMIRQVANSAADFQNKVYDQDVAYRNQLIEIFGTPYDGTIGAGKLYPAGYQGPDLSLYSYVKVNSVNDSTVPQPSPAYLTSLGSMTTGTDGNARLFSGWLMSFGVSKSWKDQFNISLMDGTNGLGKISDFSSSTVATDPTQLQNLNLPIMASGYSYVAPPEWGNRSSVGSLQSKINQMVQSQADLNRAVYAWNSATTKVLNQLRYLNAKYEWDADIASLQLAKTIFDAGADAVTTATDEAAKAAKDAAAAVGDQADAVSTFVPTDTPVVGLADGVADVPTAPARAGIKEAFFATKDVLLASGDGFDTLKTIETVIKTAADAGFDGGVASYKTKEDLLNSLLQLQTYFKDESDQRVAVFKQVQSLTQLSDDYRTLLAKGWQLQQARTTFNKRTAAQNQQNQYQDLTFRFERNAALEKYRSSLDLAAQYAYLAASAYDYDLNLSPDDAGSPYTIMADIVRQRSIGLVTSTPQIGSGGLAEDLAILRANYDVLSSRMGLNNPQVETTTLSLRSERFRLLGVNTTNTSDLSWQQLLQNPTYRKADLWQVPEFRRYCRAFAPETNGAQPGLVIPLCTKIVSGLNFFGWPLGGGDNAYDPSVFATRISSVGVALAGYDTVNLSQTPRVYLIPAGTDIMTIPNSPNQDVRQWNVLDQVLPVPYPASTANMNDPNWKPTLDTVTGSDGALGDIRQFSSFRAYGFSDTTLTAADLATVGSDSRLVGRSAWNTQWLLIIPGATLNALPNTGLDKFINSVKDIKLIIKSYGYSGN